MESEVSRHDEARYSLTVEEASFRFVNAGVPRSPRTVIRYCTRGHLDCVEVDTERNEKYLVRQESVTRRIEEIRQAYPSRRDATGLDTTGSVATHRDTRRDVEETALQERIEELERENLDLKIANRAKDQFLTMAKEQLTGLHQEVKEQAYRLGELETRLRLAAPREGRPSHGIEGEAGYPQASASTPPEPRVK
jgi:hypothetical protein